MASQTSKLKLNIIAGTDVPSYAPFNENANKIETFYTEYLNNIGKIDTATNVDAEQNAKIKVLETDNTTNKSLIESLKTDIAKVSNIKTSVYDNSNEGNIINEKEWKRAVVIVKKPTFHLVKQTPAFTSLHQYVTTVDITDVVGVDAIEVLGISACAHISTYQSGGQTPITNITNVYKLPANLSGTDFETWNVTVGTSQPVLEVDNYNGYTTMQVEIMYR